MFALIVFSSWPLTSELRRKEEKWDVKVWSFYLFQFGQGQRVMVFDFELHKAHVCRVGELCDDAQSWEQSVGGKKQTGRERILGINKINTHFTVLAFVNTVFHSICRQLAQFWNHNLNKFTEDLNLSCFSCGRLEQDCASFMFFPLVCLLLLELRFLLLIKLLLQQLCHHFSYWKIP